MINAMESYMMFGGNEVVNAARLKAYVDNGIYPKHFYITPRGCDGLDAILPCVDSDPPPGGYSLPELDLAPWYDPNAPESANFAGLLVTSVEISSAYSRTTNQNIGNGQTLGRLKRNGRTIVVRGWLIGKTCCATQYGMRWLTSVLSDAPCGNGDCNGQDLEFLDCCPSIGTGENDCLYTADGIYTRPDADTEYQRAEDFFRRMRGVGIIDGVQILTRKGSNCGCGGAGLLEVEFTMASSSPYFNSFGTLVLDEASPDVPCSEEDLECDINWVIVNAGETCNSGCPEGPDDCLDDPLCPLPPLPPLPSIPASGCGGQPLTKTRLCASAAPILEWGTDSVLNVDIYSGTTALRNLIIRIWQNPLGLDCADEEFFNNCTTCSTLLVSYIPPSSHLIISGEEKRITVECNGNVRDAGQNVTNIEGQPFTWPELTCVGACVCVDFDCGQTASDATISITRVDRVL